jgi:hypothetical protein
MRVKFSKFEMPNVVEVVEDEESFAVILKDDSVHEINKKYQDIERVTAEGDEVVMVGEMGRFRFFKSGNHEEVEK